jgi:6-phospho-beta-glucosidase
LLKTVVIGASAHSTPALFDTDCRLDEDAFSFVFVGRNPERLEGVGRAVDAFAAGRGYRVRQQRVPMDGLDAALPGADIVIIQIRSGGYEARDWDEHFPMRYGQCGDEGLGLGGLAAAWRTWPELRSILARLVVAESKALVLLLTSPVGILTRLALDEFPQLRLYGICELPWTTLSELCGRDAGEAAAAHFSYIGVNHVGWLSDVRTPTGVRLDPAQVLPLKYVALGEARERILRERSGRPSRPHELERIAEEAFRAYAHGAPEDIIAAVRKRATPWYAQALAPLLTELAGSATGVTFFLTGRNGGYCSWLDERDVIEMPFRVRSSRLERNVLSSWRRDDIRATFTSFVTYEARAADAIRRRDPNALTSAIRIHPWLQSVAVDAALLQDVLRDAPFEGVRQRAEMIA